MKQEELMKRWEYLDKIGFPRWRSVEQASFIDTLLEQQLEMVREWIEKREYNENLRKVLLEEFDKEFGLK